MRIDGLRSVDSRVPLPGLPASASGPPVNFADTLARHLTVPRSAVGDVRATIDLLRSGRPFDGGSGGPAVGVPQSSGSSSGASLATGSLADRSLAELELSALLPYSPGGNASDPFGWRALSRKIGNELVTPGFGALFERQIQQESGFSPEVAFGFRDSSAGAEGIAQLMPEYYPGVARNDPEQSLIAGARTMKHYLTVFEGDARKALAAYNSGLGRVQSLVAAHGDDWECALPAETKGYLAAIVGDTNPTVVIGAPAASEPAVFGGLGPGGVLISPVDRVLDERSTSELLQLLGIAGTAARAPADGHIVDVFASALGTTLMLDHGNGWQSSLSGLTGVTSTAGETVRRGDPLGVLAEIAGAGQGRLDFGLTLDDRAVDPTPYLLRS